MALLSSDSEEKHGEDRTMTRTSDRPTTVAGLEGVADGVAEFPLATPTDLISTP
jgi:hypothetical protein